jgi:putative membrane protein
MIEYDKHAWGRHLVEVRGSMVREIVGRVAACVAWSAVVVAYHRSVGHVDITATPHTLVGAALGLLLVFRTNASYDRFWDGRRQWGAIINDSRNIARASRAYLGGEPALRERIVLWTVAFAHAAMNSLRGEAGLGAVADRLPRAEVEGVLAAPHAPLAVAVRISETLAEARARGAISDIVLVALDNMVRSLIDEMGACERIHRTPLPFVYVAHLRRALFVYCFTLPFAMVGQYGWWTVVVTLLVAYTFFGIEEIGVEIEDPFGRDENDLPLERFCETIERNLLPLVEDARPHDRDGRPEPRVARIGDATR